MILVYSDLLILPNLIALVANLTSLRELHLGWVDMSEQGDEWCSGLAKCTPNLSVLSLPFCLLSSPICGSLASLQSLFDRGQSAVQQVDRFNSSVLRQLLLLECYPA
uniref:Uncharacterized protein n=2 Tax=Aegilops tauschii TaxID=37682 RepID=A0A453QEP3_AEGTS